VLGWLRRPETKPPTGYLLRHVLHAVFARRRGGSHRMANEPILCTSSCVRLCLRSAPVSMPLIALTQLLQYWTVTSLAGAPADPAAFVATTGHSQGVIAAVVAASSRTPDAFVDNLCRAVELLLWVGVRCLDAFPMTTMNPKVLQDSLQHNEGEPTAMLAIAGVRRAKGTRVACGAQPRRPHPAVSPRRRRCLDAQLPHHMVDEHVKAANAHLPSTRRLYIALLNGPRNVIVAGDPVRCAPPPPLCAGAVITRRALTPRAQPVSAPRGWTLRSLHGLSVSLRKIKERGGIDQTRVPFSKRELKFATRFLPVTAPFHTPYLHNVLHDLARVPRRCRAAAAYRLRPAALTALLHHSPMPAR